MRLNLWPKMRINYPQKKEGNYLFQELIYYFYVGCVGLLFISKSLHNMEAAYGLAITMCMIATTILFANFLYQEGATTI